MSREAAYFNSLPRVVHREMARLQRLFRRSDCRRALERNSGWVVLGGHGCAQPERRRKILHCLGDHSGDEDEWAIGTNSAKRVAIEKGRLYRVRHQVAFANGAQRVRWRIWPSLEPEPDQWLCEEESSKVPVGLPRPASASFSLFQHLGYSIEWSDIFVQEYSPPPGDEPGECGEEPPTILEAQSARRVLSDLVLSLIATLGGLIADLAPCCPPLEVAPSSPCLPGSGPVSPANTERVPYTRAAATHSANVALADDADEEGQDREADPC